MSLVLDCSLALSWFFADEYGADSARALTHVAHDGALVPSIWRYEMANALLFAVRRQRMTIEEREAALAQVLAFDIIVDGEGDGVLLSRTLALAERHGLTIYDAAYLELALRRALPLATRDGALRRAAQSAGVALSA